MGYRPILPLLLVIPGSRRMRRDSSPPTRSRSRPRGKRRPSRIPREEKNVSPRRRRGGDGRGEGHTREPQLAAVAATCRRVPREPRDPACLPACLSALLSASLFLNCIITIITRRTEIIIYILNCFPASASFLPFSLSSLCVVFT